MAENDHKTKYQNLNNEKSAWELIKQYSYLQDYQQVPQTSSVSHTYSDYCFGKLETLEPTETKFYRGAFQENNRHGHGDIKSNRGSNANDTMTKSQRLLKKHFGLEVAALKFSKGPRSKLAKYYLQGNGNDHDESVISLASQIQMAARWKPPPGEQYYIAHPDIHDASAFGREFGDNRSGSVDNSDPGHTPKKLKRRKIVREQGFLHNYFNPTPNSFNSCCNIINLFLQLTKRKKTTSIMTNSQITKNFEDIQKIAKIL